MSHCFNVQAGCATACSCQCVSCAVSATRIPDKHDTELARLREQLAAAEAKAAVFRLESECVACGAALQPRDAVPRCEDCNPTGEQEEDWRDRRAALADEKGTP